MRFLWPFFLVLWLSPSAASSKDFSERYDPDIQTSVHRWWFDLDVWRLGKAQLWQESNLNPDACSQVGACGLGQFMPGTWNDVVRQLHGVSGTPRSDARLGIEAWAFYQGKLRASWRPAGRTSLQRHDLGLASYNAGIGNVIRAQQECDQAVLWEQIAPCMYRVTGPANALQTRDYVVKIHMWWQMMELSK